MEHTELYQLLTYKRDELHHRMQNIKKDFSKSTQIDDVLYNIAHETKVELANINTTLKRFETGDFGICSQCGQQISTECLTKNPFQTLCENCRPT